LKVVAHGFPVLVRRLPGRRQQMREYRGGEQRVKLELLSGIRSGNLEAGVGNRRLLAESGG
jgi:hypothetical protein